MVKLKTLVDIFEIKMKYLKKLLNSKKPLIILGESFLKIKSAKFI